MCIYTQNERLAGPYLPLSPSSLKFLILIKLDFTLKGLGCCNSGKFPEDEDVFCMLHFEVNETP